jgi:ATP adenylyltransferase
MNYIAAPWRESYVRTCHRDRGCVFCRALRVGDDRKAYILYRGRHAFVILNKFPYLSGHLMVAPLRHLAAFDRLPKATSDEMMDLAKKSLAVLRKRYRPHGFNLGMNLGRSAGAGVTGHAHLHVIPRWTGDANFMPILGRTRVVIEDLDATYDRLHPLFQNGRRRLPRASGRRPREVLPC